MSRANERGVQLENELMCVFVHVYEPTSEWTGKQDERERILNARTKAANTQLYMQYEYMRDPMKVYCSNC